MMFHLFTIITFSPTSHWITLCCSSASEPCSLGTISTSYTLLSVIFPFAFLPVSFTFLSSAKAKVIFVLLLFSPSWFSFSFLACFILSSHPVSDHSPISCLRKMGSFSPLPACCICYSPLLSVAIETGRQCNGYQFCIYYLCKEEDVQLAAPYRNLQYTYTCD